MTTLNRWIGLAVFIAICLGAGDLRAIAVVLNFTIWRLNVA